MAHLFNPATIEEFAFLSARDETNDFLPAFIVGWIEEGEEDAFAGLSVEALDVVFACGDLVAVDFFDDRSGREFFVEEVERAPGDYFENPNPGAIMAPIVIDAQRGRGVAGAK